MGTCLVVIILTLPFLNPLLLNENTSQSTIRVPSDMHLPGVSVCSSFRRHSDEALALNVTHKDGFSPSSLFPTCLNVCFFAMQIRCAWLWPECCFWSVSQVHYLMQIHKCINTWSNFPFLHPQFLSLLYFSYCRSRCLYYRIKLFFCHRVCLWCWKCLTKPPASFMLSYFLSTLHLCHPVFKNIILFHTMIILSSPL